MIRSPLLSSQFGLMAWLFRSPSLLKIFSWLGFFPANKPEFLPNERRFASSPPQSPSVPLQHFILICFFFLLGFHPELNCLNFIGTRLLSNYFSVRFLPPLPRAVPSLSPVLLLTSTPNHFTVFSTFSVVQPFPVRTHLQFPPFYRSSLLEKTLIMNLEEYGKSLNPAKIPSRFFFPFFNLSQNLFWSNFYVAWFFFLYL